MKKLLLMFAILAITTSSFARLKIRIDCCSDSKNCSRKCLIVEMGPLNAAFVADNKTTFEPLSAEVKGDKLILIIDGSKISNEELKNLIANGVSIPKQITLSKKDIAENKIVGARKEFTVVDNNGQVKQTVQKDKQNAKGWPNVTITITITIKWGK